MTAKRTHDSSRLRPEKSRTAFNVVVVYDNRLAALRAVSIFGDLVPAIGQRVEPFCDLWRFEVLGLPEAQEAAALAAHGAHLIIVATQSDAELPAAVKAWLEWCIDGKQPGSTALVALSQPRLSHSEAQCRTDQFLQNAAKLGGMDFFLHEVDFPNANCEARENSSQMLVQANHNV